jgi:hypothetical protein
MIEAAAGGGAFVSIPFDVEQTFGKKRVPVRATIDGEPYRGSLVRMGPRGHLLGVLKHIRQRIGKDIGDQVDITIEEDDAPRTVVVPADLQAALNHTPTARAAFDKRSYTHRREYVRWIEEAARDATRKNRVAGTVTRLVEGEKKKSR